MWPGTALNDPPGGARGLSCALCDSVHPCFSQVALGTVTNVDEAVKWLSYSYLFVRMRANPLAYGINHKAFQVRGQGTQRSRLNDGSPLLSISLSVPLHVCLSLCLSVVRLSLSVLLPSLDYFPAVFSGPPLRRHLSDTLSLGLSESPDSALSLLLPVCLVYPTLF